MRTFSKMVRSFFLLVAIWAGIAALLFGSAGLIGWLVSLAFGFAGVLVAFLWTIICLGAGFFVRERYYTEIQEFFRDL